MGSTARCTLFFYLVNICVSITISADTNTQPGVIRKWLRRSPIGSALKTTGNCEFSFKLYDETKPHDEQPLEIYPDEIDSLVELNTAKDTLRLPHQLMYFQHIGHQDCPTQITIDLNGIYKLERFKLKAVPQLPANIDRLHSLKEFDCTTIYGAAIDFTILANMTQLEVIFTSEIVGVTISHPMHLPALRWLSIVDTPVLFWNNVSCNFPTLSFLKLHNNNLQKIPNFFRTFTMLKEFKITGNKLRSFSADLFGNMTLLESIDLSQNQISEIVTQNRVELPRLRELQLESNNLIALSFTQWIVPSLEYLALSNNLLIQVPGLVKMIHKTVKTLLMHENPWDCQWLNQTVQDIPGLQMVVSATGTCYAFCEHVCLQNMIN